MTDDTSFLQYASHSWILGRVSFDCISQRAIDPFIAAAQPGGPGRVAFAVVLVQFSGTGIQDTFHGDPTDRSLLCEGESSLPCSPLLAFRVFDLLPIFPTQGFS